MRRTERAAATITDSLLARPLLCELLRGIATILERNIPLDFTRDFKQRSWADRERLAELVRAEFRALSRDMVVRQLVGALVLAEPADH